MILGAYALPHPPLAVPVVGRGQEAEIKDTLLAFSQVSKEITNLNPDTLIFITPHGTVYSDYFHISPGGKAVGDFLRFGVSGFRIESEYDEALVQEITRYATNSNLPAGTEGERDGSLDHGVTVPLWFIRQATGDNKDGDNKIVRISQSGMSPMEHYRLGQVIAEASGKTNRRVVLIASGDLSHKLTSSGPYGYAPEGPEFDKTVVNALKTGDFSQLFNITDKKRQAAAECGYNSFMVLAGCLDGKEFDAKLLSYEGPFGVGYAVASFTLKE